MRTVLRRLNDQKAKATIKDCIDKLDGYPLILREMDVEKIKGLERTFRIRVGKYRIIFHVDETEKTIFVTHLDARKSVYRNVE